MKWEDIDRNLDIIDFNLADIERDLEFNSQIVDLSNIIVKPSSDTKKNTLIEFEQRSKNHLDDPSKENRALLMASLALLRKGSVVEGEKVFDEFKRRSSHTVSAKIFYAFENVSGRNLSSPVSCQDYSTLLKRSDDLTYEIDKVLLDYSRAAIAFYKSQTPENHKKVLDLSNKISKLESDFNKVALVNRLNEDRTVNFVWDLWRRLGTEKYSKLVSITVHYLEWGPLFWQPSRGSSISAHFPQLKTFLFGKESLLPNGVVSPHPIKRVSLSFTGSPDTVCRYKSPKVVLKLHMSNTDEYLILE